MNIKYTDLLPTTTKNFGSDNASVTEITSDGIWTFTNKSEGTLATPNGFDKNTSTYLRTSIGGIINTYIEVTFPKEYLIGKYVLELGRFHNTYTNMASWDIQARVNGVWQVVHSGTNTQQFAVKEHEFIPVMADGIRIFCTGKFGTNSWGFDNFYLYEAEMMPSNKTLILHDDEYKKFLEKINDEYTTVVPPLTSNTTPTPYVVTANVYNTSTNDLPYKAFNGIFDNGSLRSYWYTGGTSLPTNGHTLMIDLGVNSNIIPKGFGLRSVDGYRPSNIMFEGSNDTASWTSLGGAIDFVWSNDDSKIERFFTSNNTTSYRYIRLRVNKLQASYLIISTFEIYDSNSLIEGIPSTWQTVSSTLPTVNQFVDEGMDSLTPLFDRKVMELEPQEMTLDSASIGEGKVYRKKVDLNKYFDLRTITTETRDS